MRIAVYAICKNESQFVDRWMDSMSEADQVVVLDTGSTDDTVERLKKRGAQVTVELISPWRFDVARNRSLDLVSGCAGAGLAAGGRTGDLPLYLEFQP